MARTKKPQAHIYDPTTDPILVALCGADMKVVPPEERIPLGSGLQAMILSGHHPLAICPKCKKLA